MSSIKQYTAGRVEIFHSGAWGSVCGDTLTDTFATVVCRQLGYPTSHARVVGVDYFGEGSGPIWPEGVNCTGSESNLVDCQHNGWENNNCGHHQDAGIICKPGELKVPGCIYKANL